MVDLLDLPPGLPEPRDDGAAQGLVGREMPALTLRATSGVDVDLAALGGGRSVVYVYPLTGRPGQALPDGWDAIPGARGCTTEACDFRDHHAELSRAGVDRVLGLSSQTTDYQREVVERLHLPYALLADPDFRCARELGLPTFETAGHHYYARLTFVMRDGVVEHVFYPVFPPDEHAREVVAWLRGAPPANPTPVTP